MGPYDFFIPIRREPPSGRQAAWKLGPDGIFSRLEILLAKTFLRAVSELMTTYDERGRGSQWRDPQTGRWATGPPIEPELPPVRGQSSEVYEQRIEETFEPSFEIEVELRDIYKEEG